MKSCILYAGLFAFLFLGQAVLAEDPDFGNDYTSAFAIDADGSVTYGELESGGYDWFTFDSPGVTRFRITFGNGENNWKLIRFYQANEFGDPVEVTAWWQGGVGSTYRTVYMEYARPCYLRVESDPGSYNVKVETLGTTPADSYGNDCGSATPIIVDAPATVGTLDHNNNPISDDHDWFVFSTEPLHTYHIRLWFLDNSNVWFNVMNDTCGTQIYGATTDMTMTSWYGEDVKIHVQGDVNLAGNLYWLEVTDIGTYPDDHGNTWDVSTPIPADGTKIEAKIDYNAMVYSDIDWFTFIPQAHSKYDITFANGENNWKLIRVYQANAFGDPVEIDAWWQGGVSEGFHTHYFEYARPCYLKVESDGGRYSLNVKYVKTELPDTYSDSCTSPTPIAADGQALTGILNHTTPYDNDWFVFHTQPLHQYQIQLGYLNNCNVWFEVFSAGCSNVYGGTTNMTLTSWKGEDYKIRVLGDEARVGNYYTLTVTDIGTYTDDHGNVSAEATAIPKDNTPVAGSINYTSTINSDLDWMTFVAGQEGDYQFTLENTVNNWKLMRIYYEDQAGHVYEMAAFWAGGIASVTHTYHLLPRRHFIRIENDPGEYFVRVLSPEPRCGDLDHPIMAGDVNKDCRVNLQDLAMMAANWLQCNHPTSCK